MAKSTDLVPTRLTRIAKKTGSIATQRPALGSIPHDITVMGKQATEILGYLIAVNDEFVTMRHKRHGSSKQIISTFPARDVIECTGNTGGVGSILVLADVAVRSLPGQIISVKGNTIIAKDVKTGETATLRTDVPGYRVIMVVDETAAAKKYGYEAGKTAKSSKTEKADKSTKDKKKSKKVVDDF